tara:strand:+ start:779 stop:991 length:213 start_codon:yes stop_codon:yes gene_type:complete
MPRIIIPLPNQVRDKLCEIFPYGLFIININKNPSPIREGIDINSNGYALLYYLYWNSPGNFLLEQISISG